MNTIEKIEKIKVICEGSREKMLVTSNQLDVIIYLLSEPDVLVKLKDLDDLLFGIKYILIHLRSIISNTSNDLDISIDLEALK